MEELEELSTSVRSPSLEEKNNTQMSTHAPFEKMLFKIYGLEEEIKKDVEQLLALNHQINKTIDGLKNYDERMILKYRYLHNFSYPDIASKLYVDEKTVRRWEQSAISHLILPDDPIILN